MNTTTCRDMTERQFREACEKYGFRSDGFMGYYRLAAPVQNTCVSVLNAGYRRRDQLAYLLAEQSKAEKKRVAS